MRSTDQPVEPNREDPRVAYALSVLLNLPAEDTVWPDWLVYDRTTPRRDSPTVQIVPSGFFGDGYGRRESLPTLPLSEIDGVPTLFGAPVIQRLGNTLVVKSDIVASAYFMLTRYEEWVRQFEFPDRTVEN